MRRALILSILLAAGALPSTLALAQQRGQDDPAEDARRRERNREFDNQQAPLPELPNAGPCPYVKVLYDAARYVEFKDNREASANVGWTGEIEGVSATCAYRNGEPIVVDMIITFSLGKGPQAAGASKAYPYWVAVTTRNQDVLAKERFTLNASIPAGRTSTVAYDHIAGISIPRASDKVDGSTFEVLVGFDVTPQMAEFNRAGKRFRVDTTATAAAGSSAQP